MTLPSVNFAVDHLEACGLYELLDRRETRADFWRLKDLVLGLPAAEVRKAIARARSKRQPVAEAVIQHFAR